MSTLLMVGIVFLVIALIAYVMGANGVAGMSASLGKMLLGIFLILAVLMIVVGFFTGRTPV